MAGDWSVELNGTFYDLSNDPSGDLGFVVTQSLGTGLPPIKNLTNPLALHAGSIFDRSNILERNWQLVGSIIAEGSEDKEDVHTKRQNLIKSLISYPPAINQKPNPIRFRYTGAAASKDIYAYFDGGLNDEPPIGWSEENIKLRFVSPDPYFYATSESNATLNHHTTDTYRAVLRRKTRFISTADPWDVMGEPSASGTYTSINVFAEDDTYIYIGGDFTNFDNIANADYIVRYHLGTGVYSAMDSGLDDQVHDILVGADGNVYVVGEFTQVGTIPIADTEGIAMWNGSSWSAVGDPNTGATFGANGIRSIVEGNGKIYVGGDFTNLAGIANADRVAYWDGTNWNALSTGLTGGWVRAMIWKNGILYMGNGSTTPLLSSQDIVSWNGSAFSTLDSGAIVRDFAFYNGTLYAGGDELETGYMGYWNGSSWTVLSEIDDTVYSLAVVDDLLYIGGGVDTFPSLVTESLGVWNGSLLAYSDVSFPDEPAVTALLSGNQYIYVGTNGGTSTYKASDTTRVTPSGTATGYPRIEIVATSDAQIRWIRNETTKATLFLDYEIIDGETVTIETDPRVGIGVTSSIFGDIGYALLSTSNIGQFYFYLAAHDPDGLIGNDNYYTVYINQSSGITATIYYKNAYLSLD